jgi:hypothetical protein
MSTIETRIREALNPEHEPMASTCCHGQCLQGRSCPYREACTLEDLPQPKRDVVVEAVAWVAAAIVVGALAVVLGVVG